MPTLEERMEDVRAVLDAAGSKRASLFSISEGGPLSMLLAAAHPERVDKLVLYGTFAHWTAKEDYPWAPTQEQHERYRAGLRAEWGKGSDIAYFAPSLREDQTTRAFWARYQRQSASPGAAVALARMAAETDVREIVPSVAVPTLLLHRTDDRVTDVRGARYLAERIPGAQLIEYPGADHWWFAGDVDALTDAAAEFLTGEVPDREPDRVLATVLFTDIVGSTERAAEMGDRAWRQVLESHDDTVRRGVERHRGRTVKTMGDGVLATFEGPARAVRCACDLRDSVRSLGVDIRAGVHTGEVERIGDDIGGLGVHLGARVGAMARPGEVLASQTVKDLVVGSGIEWDERGTHELKGVPGEWRLYSVRSG